MMEKQVRGIEIFHVTLKLFFVWGDIEDLFLKQLTCTCSLKLKELT